MKAWGLHPQERAAAALCVCGQGLPQACLCHHSLPPLNPRLASLLPRPAGSCPEGLWHSSRQGMRRRNASQADSTGPGLTEQWTRNAPTAGSRSQGSRACQAAPGWGRGAPGTPRPLLARPFPALSPIHPVTQEHAEARCQSWDNPTPVGGRARVSGAFLALTSSRGQRGDIQPRGCWPAVPIL